MPNTLEIPAPAKINLTLDVLQKLPNGYHSLEMIMQTIDIYDVLTVSITGSPEIHLHMNKELPDKIPPEKNLVYKAAKVMQEKYHLSNGFAIKLQKNIPAAAGLAGGSADCAATLTAINTICDLGLSKEELCQVGVTLGADVPFCIMQGTMLAEGIGEILTPLPDLPPLWALLIKPHISVSTPYVYSEIDKQNIVTRPDTNAVIDAIKRKDPVGIAQKLCNVLELVTIPEYPVLAQIKEFLLQNGSIGALMSGSGPTTYGLFQDEILANFAYRAALEKYSDCDVILCQTKKPDTDKIFN